MRFEVTILGCGSATPSLRRNPASQLVNVQENFFLVDCGEGTQLQMRRLKIKFQRIHHIFISHLHGDHYLGLVGLLQSMHLLGRTKELHIYAHKDLEEMVKLHMRMSQTYLSYALVFHHLDFTQEQIIFENKVLTISTVILKHRIPCCGFVFREKLKARPMNPDKIAEYNIPFYEIGRIKDGNDFTLSDGRMIANEELTFSRPRNHAYAYCSDTAYSEKIIPHIEGVDLLYHESTFTEEMRSRAKETFHSTAKQAAEIAKKAGVKKLLLGHFSVRYREMNGFREEAGEIFPNVQLAEDGLVVKVNED